MRKMVRMVLIGLILAELMWGCAPSNIRMSERVENLPRIVYFTPPEHHTLGFWRWEVVKESEEDSTNSLFVKISEIFTNDFSKQFSRNRFQLISEKHKGQFLRVDSWIATPQGSWKIVKNSTTTKTVGIRVMIYNCYNNNCKKIFDYENSVLFPDSYEEAGEILAEKIFNKINESLF